MPYQLLVIGRGEKTVEDVRAETAKRTRKYRAKKKAAAKQSPEPSVTVTDKPKALAEQPAPAPTVKDDDGVGRHIDYHTAHESDGAQTGDKAGDKADAGKAGAEKTDLEYREFLEFGVSFATAAAAIADLLALSKKGSVWINLSEEQRGELTRAMRKLRDGANALSKLVTGDAAAASPTKSDGDAVEEFDIHVHALARLIEADICLTATNTPTVILQRVGRTLTKIVRADDDLTIPACLRREPAS